MAKFIELLRAIHDQEFPILQNLDDISRVGRSSDGAIIALRRSPGNAFYSSYRVAESYEEVKKKLLDATKEAL